MRGWIAVLIRGQVRVVLIRIEVMLIWSRLVRIKLLRRASVILLRRLSGRWGERLGRWAVIILLRGIIILRRRVVIILRGRIIIVLGRS